MRIRPYTKEEIAFAENLHRESPLSLYEILLDQATRITDLEAQLEAVQADSAWQPIETAPKETEVFIGRFIDGEFKFGRSELFYEQANEFEGETFNGWVWSVDDCSESIAEQPTHWMPLPQPPIAGEAT